MLIRLSKILLCLDQNFFSFFSGIFVSLALNVYTTIILDDKKDINYLNGLSILFMMVVSGLLIYEATLVQKVTETVTEAYKVNIGIEDVIKLQKVKKILKKIIISTVVAIIFTVVGFSFLYFDISGFNLMNYIIKEEQI